MRERQGWSAGGEAATAARALVQLAGALDQRSSAMDRGSGRSVLLGGSGNAALPERGGRLARRR